MTLRGHMLKRSLLGLAGALLLIPSTSFAASKAPHDSFYFSASLGLGYLNAHAKGDGDPFVPIDTTASGVPVVGALMVGGTPSPRLILGVGSILSYSPLTWQQSEVIGVEDTTSYFGTLTGPFIDHYFSEAVGVHGRLLAGFATLQPHGGSFAAGYGAALTLGKDWRSSDEWTLGVAATLQYSYTHGGSANTTTWLPALTFDMNFR